MRGYPEKIKYLRQYKERDFSDRIPIFIRTQKGKITIDTPDGSIKDPSFKDIARLITSRRNVFTCCSEGLIDALISSLDTDEVTILTLVGEVAKDGYLVRKTAQSLSFQSLSSPARSYLWNLAPFLKKKPSNIGEVELATMVLLDVFSRHGIPISHLWSQGAVARGFLKDEERFPEIKEDLMNARFLAGKKEDYILFHEACYGNRQESTMIGSEYQYHYDMVKAHLHILGVTPGIGGLTKVVGSKYTPDALFGAYRITTIIPEGLKFSPLPSRRHDAERDPHTYFVSGPIRDFYAKPYLDLLTKMGIPFHVLKSFELIGYPTSYPYATWASDIMDILDEEKNSIVYLKFLYQTITGSMMSIHDHITKDLTAVLTAAETYNPLLYSHVLSTQNCRVYWELFNQGENARSIRADEISTSKKIEVPEGFSEETEGLTTYLSSIYKDLPDGSNVPWRDLINKTPESKYVTYTLSRVSTLRGREEYGIKPGTRYTGVLRLEPNHGNRLGDPIKRVGDLLDHRFFSNTNNLRVCSEEKQWEEHPLI